jgi:hypothetical protein
MREIAQCVLLQCVPSSTDRSLRHPFIAVALIFLYTIFFVLSGRVNGSWRPVKCGIRAAPNRFAGLRVPEEHWIRLPGKHGIQRATSSADNDNVSSKKLP